jgi:hypothetical protein
VLQYEDVYRLCYVRLGACHRAPGGIGQGMPSPPSGSADLLPGDLQLPTDRASPWLPRLPSARAGLEAAVLTPGPLPDIEVHNWQFGGRPS